MKEGMPLEENPARWAQEEFAASTLKDPRQIKRLEKIAADCGVRGDRLTVLFAPVRSLAGSVQIVARVVEVALHKEPGPRTLTR